MTDYKSNRKGKQSFIYIYIYIYITKPILILNFKCIFSKIKIHFFFSNIIKLKVIWFTLQLYF
ncbi:hypothetical protein ACMBCM_06625, partial [Spiroplasma sp. K1]